MAVEVKICGITNLVDAEAALDAGADYLGFVLYPRSPRGIAFPVLCDIARRLAGRARLVGVFVNETPETVRRVAGEAGLSAVQLHGDEHAAEFADGVGVPLWRAVVLRTDGAHPSPQVWGGAARYVVDAAAPGQYGGSGRKADWVAARGFAERHPTVLAGGLDAATVAEAVRRVMPLCVDVASGVEVAPGRKDISAVRRFIREARGALEPVSR